jgi:hypothetical protein
MADRWGAYSANTVVRRLPPGRVFEKTSTGTQEHRNNVDLHLVNQAGLEVLLGDIGAASQNNVSACGSVPRSLERYADSFGDKVEGCPSLHRERFAGVISQDEDGRVKGWILSHQPFQGLSPHGPSPPPNIWRPMMVAPTFSKCSATVRRPDLSRRPLHCGG